MGIVAFTRELGSLGTFIAERLAARRGYRYVRREILEAAACARPIVSTRIGAEGQDFTHGREIILTEGLGEEFLEAVLTLLKDEGMRKMLGEGARERVEAQYRWEMGVKKFERLYERLKG